MLPRPTLRKIFREVFLSEESALVGFQLPSEEQLPWLENLASQLSQIDRVEARVRDEFYIALMIRASSGGGHDLEWFMIGFFPFPNMPRVTERKGLWIMDATYRRRRKAETETPVQKPEQIFQLVDAIKSKQDQIQLRAKRNAKLADLKQRSLQSRLMDLGEQHQFSFSLGESKRDVNLSIRVCGKKSAYHIAFPKGKLDAVLDQIPDLIKTLEKLRKLGVNFRTNNKPWAHNQSSWVEPGAANAVEAVESRTDEC